METTPLEDAYFAGIVDGEGSITISMYRFRRKCGRSDVNSSIKLYVTSTDMKLIDWIQERYGGKVYDKLNDIGHLGTKICYRWQALALKNILDILDKIETFLIIKKEQAAIVREFRENFVPLGGATKEERKTEWERRFKLRDRISKLNGGKLLHDDLKKGIMGGLYD